MKQFTAMAMIILVSFTTLGGFLFWQVYIYSVSEKKQSLTKNCESVVDFTLQRLEMDNLEMDNPLFSTFFESQYLGNLEFIAMSSDSIILIVLENGNVAYFTDGTLTGASTTVSVPPLSSQIVSEIITKNGISRISNLDGYLTSKEFNIGLPVLSKEGKVLCVVIVSSQANKLASMATDMIGKFLITVIFVITIAFIVTWVIANSMTRPLKQMRNAARSFERGNFDVRLRVTGQDEIADLAEAFNSMALSLAKLESMRSDFVANVSHEMKTPMTTISGFIDGILDGTIPKEKEQYYLEIISGEIKRLSRLVARTLFVSRLQSGNQEIHPAPMDIVKLIGHIIIGFEQKINEKGLHVNIDFCEQVINVFADADAISQVIYNLFDNAVKYSNEGGKIDINVTSRGSHAGVCIGNTGEGIAKEDLPFVFDRFFKTDRSRGLHSNSYGLGLYISKSIVNQHGEDLRVTSENGYTEFSFILKTTN